MLGFIVVLVLLIVLVGFFISVYNGLVRLKNQVTNGLSQIDVQLKRRHDLIPNLVSTASNYMQHELATLTAVTEARSHAQKVASQTTDVGDSQQIGLLAQAENALSRALGNFYAVAENYPELKADALMKQVMDELTNTENRIGFARQHYNDSVMFYNNQREVFPNNLISGFFKFERLAQLDFNDKSAIDVAPAVKF
ncbi:MAG: LemA family protein [Moraxella sp.]|nr:LemA family protein [Moraxella sp.]